MKRNKEQFDEYLLSLSRLHSDCDHTIALLMYLDSVENASAIDNNAACYRYGVEGTITLSYIHVAYPSTASMPCGTGNDQ